MREWPLRLAAAIATVALLSGACSKDDATEPESATTASAVDTSAPTTTTASPTTTTASPTTTTASPTTTTASPTTNTTATFDDDTAAVVNGETISRGQVLALRTTYDDATPVDAGCAVAQEGECLQDFRGDLTQLVIAEALRSGAEDDFGLAWTDEEVAERVVNPPQRYAPLFDLDRMPPYFTDEALQVQALFTLIRDGVAKELLLESADFPDVYLDEPQQVTRACVRHVLVADVETADAVLERAEAGEDLGELADELSIDTTSPGGLLLDLSGQCPVFLAGFVPEFALAAVEAPVKAAYGPVETEFGYHIILVEDRVGPPTREELIADPITWLEPSVASERYTDWLNVALANAAIEIHPLIGTWISVADGIRPPPSS